MAQNGNMSFELWMKDNVKVQLDKIYETFVRLDKKAEESLRVLRGFDDIKAERSTVRNFTLLQTTIERVKQKIIELRAIQSKVPAGVNTSSLLPAYRGLAKALRELQSMARNNDILNDKTRISETTSKVRTLLAQVNTLEKEFNKAAESQRKMNKSQDITSANALRERASQLEGVARALDKVTQAGNAQQRMWSTLQNAFGTYLSVQGLYNFTRELITIGGEFEVQRIALQNIIGDIEKANGLFQQIKDMAVVSPFSFRQLASYTKQTAAYGIPEDELFETTKRLADMSAGLGVDMNRLILAYGQVRSAAVLRGPELRQFTEAGIPMVEALAKKFTELNGVATTTGEVFDLIKKKAVPFEMVKEILWEMTDEGGRFNNMQFKLADTLAGKMSNLRDAWEIMLSNFANSDTVVGNALKGSLTLLTNIIGAVQKLSPLIVGIGAGIIAKKIATTGRFILGGRLDSQVKSAQALYLTELRRLRAEGSITKEVYAQRANLAKEERTFVEILALEGKLTRGQLRRKINEGAISAELVEQLRLLGMITEKEYQSYVTRGKIGRNFMGGGNGGGFMGFMKGGGWLIALDALVAGFMYFSESAAEAKRKMEDFHETMKQRSADIFDYLHTLQGSAPIYDSDYINGIASMLEKLKEVLPESMYNETIEEVDSLETVSEKYEYLIKVLKDLGETYDWLRIKKARLSNILAKTDLWYTEDLEGNLKDMEDAASDTEREIVALSDALNGKALPALESLIKASKDKTLREMFDGERITDWGKTFDLLYSRMSASDKAVLSGLNGKTIEESHITGEEGAMGLSIVGQQVVRAYNQMDKEARDAFSEYIKARNEESNALNDLKWQLVEVMTQSLSEVADNWGITLQQIYAIINGDEEKLTTETKEALAQHFGVSMEELEANFEYYFEKAKKEITTKSRNLFTSIIESIFHLGKRASERISNWVFETVLHIKIRPDVKTETSGLSEFVKKVLKDIGADTQTTGGKTTVTTKDGSPVSADLLKILKNSKGDVQLGKDLGEYIKNQEAALKDAKRWDKEGKEIKRISQNLASARKIYRDYWGKDYVDEKELKKNAADANKATAAQRKALAEAEKREREFLKKIQDRISQYKKFRSALAALEKEFGKKNALAFLMGDEEYKEVISGLGLSESELLDWRQALKKIIFPIDGQFNNTDARNNIVSGAYNSILQEESKERLDDLKKQAAAKLKEIEKYISDQAVKFDLYKTLFDKTGNEDFATLAFGNYTKWGKQAEGLRTKLDALLGDGLKVTDWEQDEAAVKKYFEEAGVGADKLNAAVKLYLEIQKQIHEEGKNALIAQADAIGKLYKAEDKLKAEEAKLLKLRQEGATPEEQKAQKKNVENARYEALKESHEYKTLFDATLSMAVSEAETAGRKIKSGLAKAFSEGIIDAKEYVKQIKEIDKNLNKIKSPQSKGLLGAYFFGGGLDGVETFLSDKLSNAVDRKKRALEILQSSTGAEDLQGRRNDFKNASEKEFKARELLKNFQRFSDNLVKFSINLQIVTGALDGLKGITDELSSTFEAFGNKEMANHFSDISDGIAAVSAILTPANNIVSNAMSGNISGTISSIITAPLQLFTGPLKLFAALHDKRIQREIEASQQREKEYSLIQQNLEKWLSYSLGGVFSNNSPEVRNLLARLHTTIYERYLKRGEGGKVEIGDRVKKGVSANTVSAYNKAIQSGEYYDAAYALKLAQLDEKRLQLSKEAEKSNRDESKESELKSEIYEAELALNHFAEEMAKTLYDIDVKSWAKELASAIVNAWAAGEDAVKAYKDKVKDLMKTVATNILSQKVLEIALAPVEELVAERMAKKKGKLDLDDVADIAEQMVKSTDEAAETTISLLDALKERGYDFGTTESSSNGISKNITENQADRLLSYVNAIRADVSVQKFDVTAIRKAVESMAGSNNVLAQVQVQQLRSIVSNTARNAKAAEDIYHALELARSDANFGFYGK